MPSRLLPGISRPRTLLGMGLVLATIFGAALAYAPRADALIDAHYCGYSGRNTPAHNWCWQNNEHYWDYNEAYYPGGGTFNFCTALVRFNTRGTVREACWPAPNSNDYVSVGYCNNGLGLDAGTGNQDNSDHSIGGYAREISGGGC